MTLPILNKGDTVLVVEYMRHGGSNCFPGKVAKVTPTGQLTIDCGVWSTGATRVFRFKPKWNSFSEIGRGQYSSQWYNLIIGEEEIDKAKRSVLKDRATRAGAHKIRELRDAIAGVHPRELEAMQVAAKQLLDAVIAARLIQSLPEAAPEQD